MSPEKHIFKLPTNPAQLAGKLLNQLRNQKLSPERRREIALNAAKKSAEVRKERIRKRKLGVLD